MYPIGPISNRTLFQVLADQLRAVRRACDAIIPLFLMTSPATHEETIDYLTANQYLGLDPASVQVFCQGTMPAVDVHTGRILLEAPDRLSLSPDGHGGTVAALARHGSLKKMEQLGIDYIFYFQVDNPLVSVCDAEFIGYHILAGSEMSTQVVAKQEPGDRVGNVVEVDGRLQIIEYSDLPLEAAERRHPDGTLVMWAGNTAVHVIDRAFMERAQSEAILPFHRALKKVVTIDERGEEVVPDHPNAIKFERFIFDLLPSAKNSIVVEVREEEYFAPVKNPSGASKDSPNTAQAAMVRQHRRLLRAAGAIVSEDVCVEVNPLFARDVSEMKLRLASGVCIDGPTYFASVEK
ncbi:MAG: UTP--glucose-1-phosphate uridylyltransferase [Planctomycetota bacterium]|nr:UTP--glucose-1-phosphate uridylyltransferase [Planctomycetota bacterium]